MINKNYTKFKNVILTNKDFIINVLKDFENLEIDNIEKFFDSKIKITYHNNLWSILCDTEKVIYIIEKLFICYNIWKIFKNNILIRIDPTFSKIILKKGNKFIKKINIDVKLYQTFENSTIIFVAGNNKNDVLDVVDYIIHLLNHNNINMQFIWVNLLYFMNTLRYILPKNINLEKDVKIRFSNFNDNLTLNENSNKKRICVVGLSENFNDIWNYMKKVIEKDKMDNLNKIEYLNIENNNMKKIKIIDNKKIMLITRKIDKHHLQIPLHKDKLPDTIYSSSF